MFKWEFLLSLWVTLILPNEAFIYWSHVVCRLGFKLMWTLNLIKTLMTLSGERTFLAGDCTYRPNLKENCTLIASKCPSLVCIWKVSELRSLCGCNQFLDWRLTLECVEGRIIREVLLRILLFVFFNSVSFMKHNYVIFSKQILYFCSVASFSKHRVDNTVICTKSFLEHFFSLQSNKYITIHILRIHKRV